MLLKSCKNVESLAAKQVERRVEKEKKIGLNRDLNPGPRTFMVTMRV